MIYGSPIEIETDCQALCNVLLNKKQSSTHIRWEESIVCWHITDIRHSPGVTNVVADAISHKWSEARGPSHNDDGASWPVQPDWEVASGIVNNIMQVTVTTDTDEHTRLCQEFSDDPWLKEVMEALTNGDMLDIRA